MSAPIRRIPPRHLLRWSPSDFPTFDGQPTSLLEWTSQINLLMPAYFPYYDKKGKTGMPLFVNFCIGLFTGRAAEWAATENFKIPKTATTAEEVLDSLLGMITGAFKDKTVTRAAKEKVKEFTGHGLSFVQFRIEFETLCRKAEIPVYGKSAASLVAEFFRSALTSSNLRTLKTIPPPGTEDCVDPEDLTLEEMYRILEPRWYVQYPLETHQHRLCHKATHYRKRQRHNHHLHRWLDQAVTLGSDDREDTHSEEVCIYLSLYVTPDTVEVAIFLFFL
jgi:hypothetical protein